MRYAYRYCIVLLYKEKRYFISDYIHRIKFKKTENSLNLVSLTVSYSLIICQSFHINKF